MTTQENLLPLKEVNQVPLLDSRELNQRLGIEHESLMKLIETHKTAIEEDFGSLRFEIGTRKREIGGTTFKFTLLTEDQAIFVITLCRNTKEAVAVKALVVKSFSNFRKKLAEKTEKSFQPLYALDKVYRDKTGTYFLNTKLEHGIFRVISINLFNSDLVFSITETTKPFYLRDMVELSKHEFDSLIHILLAKLHASLISIAH